MLSTATDHCLLLVSAYTELKNLLHCGTLRAQHCKAYTATLPCTLVLTSTVTQVAARHQRQSARCNTVTSQQLHERFTLWRFKLAVGAPSYDAHSSLACTVHKAFPCFWVKACTVNIFIQGVHFIHYLQVTHSVDSGHWLQRTGIRISVWVLYNTLAAYSSTRNEYSVVRVDMCRFAQQLVIIYANSVITNMHYYWQSVQDAHYQLHDVAVIKLQLSNTTIRQHKRLQADLTPVTTTHHVHL
jgi:hypothetical protein